MKEIIRLGKWKERIEHLLSESSRVRDAGLRVGFISGHFLDTAYKEGTLIGGLDTPEVFVINLEEVDCLTFIEYVEAMRLSSSYPEFKENLKRVRYRSGVVSFDRRNHFFTDWPGCNPALVSDATEAIAPQRVRVVTKLLNQREDGTAFIAGIRPVEREIRYIPLNAIDETVIKGLGTGDYLGIYSEARGLDVTHVGIVIKDEEDICLRHASSRYRKVIDEDLRAYLSDKPGIIVLRPKGVSDA
jgi:hypothetical protein